MPTTVERRRAATDTAPARRLRTEMAAARLRFVWFGTRKTLTPEQKAEAADAFGAEGQFLSAGKKLIDTCHPRVKGVSAVRNRAVSYWRAVSLPYPEPGLRLIRQDRLDAFDVQMTAYQAELAAAVEELDEHFDALKSAARQRLGRLFNARDYPDSLLGLFEVSWDFPSVEPPDFLRELHPQLYREECQRVQARFDEAVRLAEEAFVEELSQLVAHLTERLSGAEDGKPKVFRDSAIGNLREFFARFQSLNVRSNEQLDRLVAQCQQVVGGIEPRQLREDQPLRQRVAGQLSAVESVLDGLLVDRPRRRIVRHPK
ncbi:MAG: hypothetical protein AB7O62_22905 [Pirellulales bacterium]